MQSKIKSMTEDPGRDKFSSLQDHCILHLITHVEDYSPQTLALLPRHLRQTILSSMAPLHLYQLDNTKVADGISTQSIWEDILSLTKMSGFKSSEKAQDLYINSVYHAVLHKFPSDIFTIPVVCEALSIELALFGLFKCHLNEGIIHLLQQKESPFVYIQERQCFINVDVEGYKNFIKHHCKSHTKNSCEPKVIFNRMHQFVEEVIYSCHCLITQRFNICFTQRLVAILKRAKALPNALWIHAQRIVYNELWVPEKKEGLLQYVFDGSKVNQITINSDHEPPNTTCAILNTLLSSSQLCLKHLDVGPLITGETITSLAPSLVAYDGLISLKLVMDDSTIREAHSVGCIIANQEALECVELAEKANRGQQRNHTLLNDEALLTSLGVLFQNIHFKTLRLAGFTIPQEFVKSIVSAFLHSTPSNECCTLMFTDTKLPESNDLEPTSNNSRFVTSHVSQENMKKFGPRKKFVMRNMSLSPSFMKWFVEIPCVCLGELNAIHVKCECHDSIRPHLKAHPNFNVNKLSF